MRIVWAGFGMWVSGFGVSSDHGITPPGFWILRAQGPRSFGGKGGTVTRDRGRSLEGPF